MSLFSFLPADWLIWNYLSYYISLMPLGPYSHFVVLSFDFKCIRSDQFNSIYAIPSCLSLIEFSSVFSVHRVENTVVLSPDCTHWNRRNWKNWYSKYKLFLFCKHRRFEDNFKHMLYQILQNHLNELFIYAIIKQSL